jgi:hypothetical protein
MLQFLNNDFCGNENSCSSVPKMQQKWKFLEKSHLVIDPGIVSLVITVSNDRMLGNDLIFTQLFPRKMHFLRSWTMNSNRTLPCIVQNSSNEKHKMRCFVGNIAKNDTVVLQLQYMIEEPLIDISNVTVQSSLTSSIVEAEQKVVFENYTVQTARRLYADIKRY